MKFRLCPWLLTLLATSGLSGSTLAAPPPVDPPASARPATKAEEKPLDPNRIEFGALPLIAGSTDIGVAVGVIASIAKFDQNYSPYRWSAALISTVAGKEAPDGELEFPIQTHFLSIDFPGLLDDRLRVILTPSVLWNAISPYYGIGNASPLEERWERYDPQKQPGEYERARRYYQYRWLQAGAGVNARLKLTKRVSWFVSGNVSVSSTSLYADSKLAADARGESGPRVKSMMVGLEDHLLMVASTGFIFDTRDHETSPTSGMFHDLSIRAGQALGSPFTYGGANLTMRFYAPVIGERLVLASRLVTDVLVGSAPFYQLSLVGGLLPFSGPGSGFAVRGVPLGRYAGKLKIIGNLELRSTFVSFTALAQRLHLGAAAFLDAGRVRTDFEQHPELDIGAPPLKYGAGGGLRLRWGEAFLVRFDMGKSPDGLGVIFATNQIF
jgi:hypothetical protein